MRISAFPLIKDLAFGLCMCFVSLSALGQEERPRVVIETDSGTITLELFNETPLHRDNFLKLAREGFYDGTTFHRVIDDFMIQGGNPSTKENAASPADGPGYTIPAEINGELFHKKGALAAARQGDNVNPKRESSGSQFYIVEGRVFEDKDLDMFENKINNDLRSKMIQAFFSSPENKEYLARVKKAQQERNQEEMTAVMGEVNPIIDAKMEDKAYTFSEEQREAYQTIGGTPHLDNQYTVFGQVVEGIEVVERIAATETKSDAPVTPIRMTVKVVEEP